MPPSTRGGKNRRKAKHAPDKMMPTLPASVVGQILDEYCELERLGPDGDAGASSAASHLLTLSKAISAYLIPHIYHHVHLKSRRSLQLFLTRPKATSYRHLHCFCCEMEDASHRSIDMWVHLERPEQWEGPCAELKRKLKAGAMQWERDYLSRYPNRGDTLDGMTRKEKEVYLLQQMMPQSATWTITDRTPSIPHLLDCLSFDILSIQTYGQTMCCGPSDVFTRLSLTSHFQLRPRIFQIPLVNGTETNFRLVHSISLLGLMAEGAVLQIQLVVSKQDAIACYEAAGSPESLGVIGLQKLHLKSARTTCTLTYGEVPHAVCEYDNAMWEPGRWIPRPVQACPHFTPAVLDPTHEPYYDAIKAAFELVMSGQKPFLESWEEGRELIERCVRDGGLEGLYVPAAW